MRRVYNQHRKNSDDNGNGCIAFALLALIALPIYGIYLIFQGDDDEKGTGVILTIIGIIIWIIIGIVGK